VKITGNRVFLSEILTEVMALPEVADAQVVSRDNNGVTQIALFAVLKDASISTDGASKLRPLSSRVPHYMLPGEIQLFRQMPRTSNGKLDRQRLLRIAGY
jgi:acyl-coenzyme A synthetase/AMP-(fatty) acid ligase